MLFTCSFTWGLQGPFNPYLVLWPFLRLFSISTTLLSSSWVPEVVSWALLCAAKPTPDYFMLMAGLESALMLYCACGVTAARLGIFFLAGLGLGESCWPALSVTCLLPVARSLLRLPSGPLLLWCVAVLVRHL